jgi:non-specific serine/threonine protein kinase
LDAGAEPGQFEGRVEFGAVVRQHRLIAGLTQEGLAERAGVGVRTVQGLENGENLPRRETLRRLAEALGLSADDAPHLADGTAKHLVGVGVRLRLLSTPVTAQFRSLLRPEDRPNNLPHQLTPFIGRGREVAAVAARLVQPDVPLLTLTGPGGVGKTRLALQAAAEVLGEPGSDRRSFPDGVCFVDLAPLADPALVLTTIGQVLGVAEVTGRLIMETLVDHLRDKCLLLVLDNCERLLPEVGVTVAALLTSAPDVTALATSREPLRISGEHQYPVLPLRLPDPGRPAEVDSLARTEAVALFVQRAGAAAPDFALSAENAAAVVEICRRLDGLPLAIELAAARTNILSSKAIAARLDQPLKLLVGGPRDRRPRQQTLRATLDWSHDLLGPEEQAVFRRLAVFVGGCTLEAAKAVCADPGAGMAEPADGCSRKSAHDISTVLESLTNKSHLRRDEQRLGEPRFVLLETIREYGLNQLIAHCELASVRNSHLQWCLQLAGPLQPDHTDPVEVALLEQEQDNFRAALRWCIESNQARLGLRLGERMWLFWYMRGRWTEGRAWLNELLALPAAQMPLAERAAALAVAGQLAIDQCDFGSAETPLMEGQQLAKRVGDKHVLALCLYHRASAAGVQGRPLTAISLFEQSLEVSQRLDDAWSAAITRQSMASITYEMGDVDRAEELANMALALFREQGHLWGVARSMVLLVASEQQERRRAAVALHADGVEAVLRVAQLLGAVGRHRPTRMHVGIDQRCQRLRRLDGRIQVQSQLARQAQVGAEASRADDFIERAYGLAVLAD